MAVLFGGKHTDSLATLWHNIFSKKVAYASSFVAPEHLPLTESATKFHCRSVNYQIMIWMRKADSMNAKNWGGTCWIISSSKSCQEWMLLPMVYWKSFIVISPIPARHSTALVDNMDYHALLPVDTVKNQKCDNPYDNSFQKNQRKKMINDELYERLFISNV